MATRRAGTTTKRPDTGPAKEARGGAALRTELPRRRRPLPEPETEPPNGGIPALDPQGASYLRLAWESLRGKIPADIHDNVSDVIEALQPEIPDAAFVKGGPALLAAAEAALAELTPDEEQIPDLCEQLRTAIGGVRGI